MRELEAAIDISIDPGPGRAVRAPFRLSRQAFVVSILAHVLTGYALSRHLLPGTSPPPTAEFFLFDMPARPPEVAPVPPPVEPLPEIREEPVPAPPPVQPAPEPTVVVEPRPTVVVEPPAVVEPEPAPQPEPARTLEQELAPLPRSPNDIDFEEERQHAANQVVTARAAKQQYLTFSVDDVASPRPEPEPEKLSIFDGTGASAAKGPTAGQLGQARTKFGQHMSSLCNALTGGFSLMGWGSFCAGPSESEPSGLYPEVRPEYLDLMPVCVDTRDTAPELALTAPFPTVKCRLVEPDESGVLP
jgi:outer membrane biosynthesis protein TonB